MSQSTYHQLVDATSQKHRKLNNRLSWLSFIRLLLFIGVIAGVYQWLANHSTAGLVLAILLTLLFLYSIRLYDNVKSKADFVKALMEVNLHEIAFLEGKPAAYGSGEEYIDPHHPYSYDLDLFGQGSLYQFLNRTTTIPGRSKLANTLLRPALSGLEERQNAVKELKDMLAFRQDLQALGTIHANEKKDLDKLQTWITGMPAFPNSSIYYALLVLPLATLTLLSLYIFSENGRYLNLFYLSFGINLAATFGFARMMSKQLAISGTVTKVLRQFSAQLEQIEKQQFQSAYLRDMQGRLRRNGVNASVAIKRLAGLFNYLDFIMNLLVSVLLNGLSLFHVHILYSLEGWKKKHAGHILSWLDVIAEVEALASFANFSFNNDTFCFPELSSKRQWTATGIGHPLIRKEKRVTNDISFSEEKFVILTGSNMSGKSTFLRTLGVNLVLARAGGPVCASTCRLFPFNLYVSMRITDSLQDSESLFYAELKRLQEIIAHLQQDNNTFVVLDEILKGTNSNDKHNGTVGLIRKLAAHRCFGIIATHDLTVAELTSQYPGYMTNKAFESVIINDELVFDYRLKTGVCSKLNASFLMKKMGIID